MACARVAATGTDVALVQGRAAPLAQALTLEIALASGMGRSTAGREALHEAHRVACLAAAAVWIHGELGDDDQLRARLDPLACGELDPLLRQAQARPRAALRGLGLVLLLTTAALGADASNDPGLAAGTTSGLLEGGDPRSEGAGPGIVGAPLLILLGIVVLGLATVILTVVLARLTRRG